MDEKQQKELENRYSKLINENGKIEKIESLGMKKLAYEVKKQKEGIYVQIYFESETSFIAELERKIRIDNDVIKFLVVKRED